MGNGVSGARGQDICDRTRAFALRIIRLYRHVNTSTEGQVLGKQLLRLGTSIGANVEEAQAAQSPRDFVHKMNIALKESRETRYWLLLLRDAECVPASRLTELIDETEQLARILYTIIKKNKDK